MQGCNRESKGRRSLFNGRFLRVAIETSTLGIGEIVYCFVDEGFQFRVKTQRDVNGVREGIFSHEDRYKFETYK